MPPAIHHLTPQQQQRLLELERVYGSGNGYYDTRSAQPSQPVPPNYENRMIPPMSQPTEQPQGFQVVEVASEEEARKQMPDMTGAVRIFVQKEGEQVIRIYSKRINMDTFDAEFCIYEKSALPAENPVLEDRSPNLLEVMQTLDGKIDSLNAGIQGIREVLSNERTTEPEHDKVSAPKSTRSSKG